MLKEDYKIYEGKMKKSIDSVAADFASVRAGRANASVLDRIMVDYYGSPTPIQQIAAISSPDARTLLISPWDKTAVKSIEKAIQNSDLGINPQNDGASIRLSFPQLTEERRKELVKQIHKYAENGKVAIRNIRRDAMEAFKKKEKASEITEDDLKDLETAMQKSLLVKESQHTGEETMKDYRNCLARFLADSHNSLDYPLLESDVLTFFAAIPDTSPARYNKPFQNINAFLNWALEQELIEKNPIKVHKLHKRRDDGNIKPLPVDKLQAFLASLDKSTYTGLRDYVI